MYKITIEETKTVKKTVGKEWETTEQDENGKREYGYTPEIEKEVEVKQVVYTQLVESLDLGDHVIERRSGQRARLSKHANLLTEYHQGWDRANAEGRLEPRAYLGEAARRAFRNPRGDAAARPQAPESHRFPDCARAGGY